VTDVALSTAKPIRYRCDHDVNEFSYFALTYALAAYYWPPQSSV